MLEKNIEKLAASNARKAGWITWKFSSPAHRGVPDRIFLNEGVVVFIEFKTATGKVSALQERELKTINEHGGIAYVCRSAEDCAVVLANELQFKRSNRFTQSHLFKAV